MDLLIRLPSTVPRSNLSDWKARELQALSANGRQFFLVFRERSSRSAEEMVAHSQDNGKQWAYGKK